ncbi:MAG: hypothetical protein QME49_07265, partial [bacterium]|nr:hypothetical protein [bacterium]
MESVFSSKLDVWKLLELHDVPGRKQKRLTEVRPLSEMRSLTNNSYFKNILIQVMNDMAMRQLSDSLELAVGNQPLAVSSVDAMGVAPLTPAAVNQAVSSQPSAVSSVDVGVAPLASATVDQAVSSQQPVVSSVDAMRVAPLAPAAVEQAV